MNEAPLTELEAARLGRVTVRAAVVLTVAVLLLLFVVFVLMVATVAGGTA